jgi:hypothetical protein
MLNWRVASRALAGQTLRVAQLEGGWTEPQACAAALGDQNQEATTASNPASEAVTCRFARSCWQYACSICYPSSMIPVADTKPCRSPLALYLCSRHHRTHPTRRDLKLQRLVCVQFPDSMRCDAQLAVTNPTLTLNRNIHLDFKDGSILHTSLPLALVGSPMPRIWLKFRRGRRWPDKART